MGQYVLGVSGASGIILAKKALRWLVQMGHEVHLVPSKAALLTASIELGEQKDFLSDLPDPLAEQVKIYRNSDLTAPFASGSFRVEGMLIIPCSMGSLAAIATGLGDNLLRRAADVMLKERRRLVMVPRETPLSEIHLENMLKLTRMGAVMLPPVPAWYNEPQSLHDVENGIVGRALDLLGLEPHYKRWSTRVSV